MLSIFGVSIVLYFIKMLSSSRNYSTFYPKLNEDPKNKVLIKKGDKKISWVINKRLN